MKPALATAGGALLRRWSATGHSSMLVAVVCLLSLVPALAQGGAVWSASKANNRIFTIDFANGTTTVVNTDANLHKGLDSLALVNRGSAFDLLVGDPIAQRILLYRNAEAEGAAEIVLSSSTLRPTSLSLHPGNHLFFLSQAVGNSSQNQVSVLLRDSSCPDPTRPQCLNGGYRLPVGRIRSDLRINGQVVTFGDSHFVRRTGGVLNAGDFLVVAATPAAVFRFRAADLQAFLVNLATGTPPEIEPDLFIAPTADGATFGGIEELPSGNLLITTRGGQIRRYDRNGVRLMPDFADLGNNGTFYLAGGVEDERDKIYVAFRNGGTVMRFDVQADIGVRDGVVSAQFPVDVVTGGANTVITQPGNSRNILAHPVVQTRIELLLNTTVTSVSVFTCTDPRIVNGVFNPGPTTLASCDPTLAELQDIVVPAHMRALPNLLGVETFVVVQIVSNGEEFGPVLFDGLEELVTGFNASCTGDTALQPQMFWHPRNGELPPNAAFPEQGELSNISRSCGSSRGGARDQSWVVLNARDTRAPLAIAAERLTNLGIVLQQEGSCIPRQRKNSLDNIFTSAVRNFFERDRFDRAQSDIVAFEATVAANPNDFLACSANLFGDLRVRALQFIFQDQRHLQFGQ